MHDVFRFLRNCSYSLLSWVFPVTSRQPVPLKLYCVRQWKGWCLHMSRRRIKRMFFLSRLLCHSTHYSETPTLSFNIYSLYCDIKTGRTKYFILHGSRWMHLVKSKLLSAYYFKYLEKVNHEKIFFTDEMKKVNDF